MKVDARETFPIYIIMNYVGQWYFMAENRFSKFNLEDRAGT
jgi:hypothetical protein